MENKEYYLCYVDGNKAWFTDNWEHIWGDDWNDAPYEYNAGNPYKHYYENGKEIPIGLKELYYELPNEWVKLPCDFGLNSPYSVEMINKGAVAWIVGNNFIIPAKTEYKKFIKIIEENDGIIYIPRKEII